ncbi:MAG: formylglycine-generating enzyme family protein, partial [Gammaproteobacteria bacterium]
VQRWMRAMVEGGGLSPLDRAIAGMALSVLGDEREFDELIPIHADEFWMGDDQDNDAKPRHRLRLPAFQIGTYPVTNGQYLRFVQATRRAWDSADADKVEKRNHPARYVTWHDALAYCDWLTGEWRSTGNIGASEHATLPSEAEWERAARGTDGRVFPWAEDWREDCANTIEAGIGDTCAVGIFPSGRSETGCLDMVGNVWEWTRSLWGKDWEKPDFAYPYDPNDPQREDLDARNNVPRVLRGGSWRYYRDSRAVPFASGFLPTSGTTASVFGLWCAALFLSSVLCKLCSLRLRSLCLWRGCGGDFSHWPPERLPVRQSVASAPRCRSGQLVWIP